MVGARGNKIFRDGWIGARTINGYQTIRTQSLLNLISHPPALRSRNFLNDPPLISLFICIEFYENSGRLAVKMH